MKMADRLPTDVFFFCKTNKKINIHNPLYIAVRNKKNGPQLTMQNASHSRDSSCSLDLFSRFSFSNLSFFLLFITCLIHQYLLPSIYYHFSDIFTLSPRAGPVKNCIKKNPFMVFSTFQLDKSGKIPRHH